MPAAGVLLPLAPGHGTVLRFAGEVSVPRTTAALAGPWAASILPGAVLRGPKPGDGSLLESGRGTIPWGDSRGESGGDPDAVRAQASLISVVVN